MGEEGSGAAREEVMVKVEARVEVKVKMKLKLKVKLKAEGAEARGAFQLPSGLRRRQAGSAKTVAAG